MKHTVSNILQLASYLKSKQLSNNLQGSAILKTGKTKKQLGRRRRRCRQTMAWEEDDRAGDAKTDNDEDVNVKIGQTGKYFSFLLLMELLFTRKQRILALVVISLRFFALLRLCCCCWRAIWRQTTAAAATAVIGKKS